MIADSGPCLICFLEQHGSKRLSENLEAFKTCVMSYLCIFRNDAWKQGVRTGQWMAHIGRRMSEHTTLQQGRGPRTKGLLVHKTV